MFKNLTLYLAILGFGLVSNVSNGASSTPSSASKTGTTAFTLSVGPSGGTYNKPQNIILSTTDKSAKIYYTDDGSSPDKSSSIYTKSISIKTNTRLRAIAIDGAGNKSQKVDEKYTFDIQPPAVKAVLDGASGTVTLTTNEPATIYYTVDNTKPTTSSTRYTTPLLLTKQTLVKYFAVDTAGNRSNIEFKKYILRHFLR